MPITITPTGQFVDSVTGNPVNLPPQRPNLPMRSRTGATSEMEMRAMDEAMQDPNLRNLNIPPMGQQELQNILTNPSMGMEGEMAQENIPANRDMGMDSMMPQTEGEMSIEEKLDILMRMGLSQDEAMEAVALENSLPATNPSEFGGARSEGEMGALSGVPTGGAMMPPPMQRPMQNPNSLEQMRMEGRDRSFNPNDMLRPDNTPNT